MSLPFISAMTAMISGAQAVIGTDYALYSVMQNVEKDKLPAVVMSLVNSMEWNHHTATGTFTLTLLDRADPLKDHRTNITDHTLKLYAFQKALKELPSTAGYLVDPTYSWTEMVERVGEQAQVSDSDILMGYITVNFGIGQP